MTSETPRVRTSDAERERIAETLRNAVAEGRLTLEEGDERLAALYATKFRDELGGLINDLPPVPDAKGSRRRGPGHGWGPNWAHDGGWGAGWGPGGGWDPSGAPRPTSPQAAGPQSGGPQDSDAPGMYDGGYGAPGYGGGYGGPGRGQPGPGWGGPGWGHRGFAPWRLLRAFVLVAIIASIVSMAHGHFFFFPLIPLAFIAVGVLRCGVFRRLRRGQSQ